MSEQVRKAAALAILKEWLMGQDPRIIDVLAQPKIPSHWAAAKVCWDEDGLYITAILKDERLPGHTGQVSLCLSKELWPDVAGAGHPGKGIRDYALRVIQQGAEWALEALIERQSKSLTGPGYAARWQPNGKQHA